MTTYIENLEANLDNLRIQESNIRTEITRLEKISNNIEYADHYFQRTQKELQRLFQELGNNTMPQSFDQLSQIILNNNFDPQTLIDVNNQIHALRNSLPNTSLIENTIRLSKDIGFTSDLLVIFNDIWNAIRVNGTTNAIKPSNFKNELITQSENNSHNYWSYPRTQYKLEEGSTRKISKAISVNICKNLKGVVVYLIDLKSNMRTKFVLTDSSSEASQELSMWLKGTDLYQPIAKLPPLPRDSFKQTIIDAFLN